MRIRRPRPHGADAGLKRAMGPSQGAQCRREGGTLLLEQGKNKTQNVGRKQNRPGGIAGVGGESFVATYDLSGVCVPRAS